MNDAKTSALHFYSGSVDQSNMQHIRFDGPILTGVNHLLLSQCDCQIQFETEETAEIAHERTGFSYVSQRPDTLYMPFMSGQESEHSIIPVNDAIYRFAYYNGWQLLIDGRKTAVTMAAGAECNPEESGDEWPVPIGATLDGVTGVKWENGFYFLCFESYEALIRAYDKTAWTITEVSTKHELRVNIDEGDFLCAYKNADGKRVQGRFSAINIIR